MTTEILTLSDGIITIDFLDPQRGWHLAEWGQAITGYKGGGTFQSSSLTDGRRLVDKRFENGTEILVLRLDQSTDDGIHETVQDLLRLLEQATDYWTGNNTIDAVYLTAKSGRETNTRYALLRNYRLDQLPNPYLNPFLQPGGSRVYAEIAIVLERGPWMSNIPGQSDGVSGSNAREWDTDGLKFLIYDDLGTTLPAPTEDYIMTAVGNSRLIAAPTQSADDMYVSTDHGLTWVAVTGGSGVGIAAVLKISDDDILFSETGNEILRSTDQGDSVSVHSTDIGGGPLIQLNDGSLLAGEGADIYNSTDGGINWTNIATITGIGGGGVVSLAVSPVTNTVIADIQYGAGGHPNNWIYRSADDGLTWSRVFTEPGGGMDAEGFNSLAVDSDGVFYKAMGVGPIDILSSNDDGLTWFDVNGGSLSQAPDFVFVDSQDRVWAVVDEGGGGSFDIYYSLDKGNNFTLTVDDIGSGGFILGLGSMTESNDEDLYIGGGELSVGVGGFARRLSAGTQGTWGTDTADRLDIVNHHKVAQLTHIFVDDGGVFGSNEFPVSASFNLLPATAVVDDAIYFGIDNSVANNAPFCSVRLNISSGAVSTGSHTITWEYYDGAWTASTVQDNTADFTIEGRNSIHWKQPSDWTGVTINSVAALWVRARVSAVSGVLTGPEQADEDIITNNLNYIQIAAAQVGGDISALARLQLRNRSDGGTPDMAGNRFIAGLRSTDRGSGFVAYLNCAGSNNPVGIGVTAGTNVSSAADNSVASGDRQIYNPAGVEAMGDRVTFTIPTTLSQQWYGVFHAFLRCRQSSGSAGDFSVRLQISVGTGGVTFTGETIALATTGDWQLIDLGRLEIAPNLFNATEQGDQLDLIIQASAASGTPDLYLYDLVLIPTDEWSCDFTDEVNSATSDVGQSELFDIDSLSFLRREIRGFARKTSDLIYATYKPVANGKAIFQANTQQRFWFLIARYGASAEWISEPYDVYSVELSKNQRYLAARGGR